MTSPIVVGTVAVEVSASARGLAKELRDSVIKEFKSAGIDKALTEALSKRKIKVPVEPVFDERSTPGAPRTPRGPRTPRQQVPDTDPLLRAFQQDVARQMRALARQAVKIPVTADTDELRRGIAAGLESIKKNTKAQIPTEPEGQETYRRDLTALVREVSGQIKASVPVEISPADARRQARQAALAATRAAPPVRLRVDIDRSSLRAATATLSRLGKTAGGLVKVAGALGAIGGAAGAGAAGLAGLASAAGGAIQLLAGLASAAAAASGALLALPGGLSIAAVGVGTLTLATAGLSDAFKAAAKDGASLDEVVKDLAPSAQQLVRAVVALQPAWEAMQRAVQQTLFTGVAADLTRLSNSILPTVTAGFVGVADVLNGQLRAALAELSTANTRIRLDQIFDSARTAIDNLTVAVRPLIQALADVTAVGAGIIAEQTTGLGRLIADISERLSDLAESGELRTIILDGLDMLKQFGAAAADVFGIVKGIFTAVPAGGGGLFALLDQLNTLVNSVQGQTALGELFANLAEVGSALTPVLLAVAQALGPVSGAIATIAAAFAPTLVTLVQSLGSALVALTPGFLALGPLVEALARGFGPLAQILTGLVVGAAPGLTALVDGLVAGLEALAPAAGPVGEALGAIAQAVAPLLGVLGNQLAIVLTALAGILGGVASEFTPLISLFGEVTTILAQALTPILVQLAQQLLPVMAQAGAQIAAAFVPLIPVIAQIASSLATQLAAALPGLIASFTRMVPILVQLAEQFGGALLDALVQLLPHVPALQQAGLLLVQALLDLFVALYPILPSLIQLALLVAQAAIDSGALTTVIVLLAGTIRTTTGVIKAITVVVDLMVIAFRTSVEAVGRMGRAIRDAAGTAYNAVKELPGKIRDALGDAGRILYNAGKNVIRGLIDGIKSMFGSLGNVMSDVAGTVRNYLPFSPAKEGPLSGRGNPYYSGQSIVQLLAGGVRSNLGVAGAAASDLAAQFALDGSVLAGISSAPATPDPGRLVAEWIGGDGDPIVRGIRESVRIYYDGSAQKAFGTGARP